MMNEALSTSAATEGRLRTLVVSGGQPGVGSTSLAIHLALALASEALRVVLVETDSSHAEIATRCGVSAAIGIGDVLAGRKSIHEALALGPAGIHILPGTSSQSARTKIDERAIQRLLRQIQSLAPHVDWLVVDAGSQSDELAANLWRIAEIVLLVTTPHAAAVLDSYALIKTLLSRSYAAPPQLVVNQADDVQAADVHRRIDQSCRRFLEVSVELAAALPFDSAAEGLKLASSKQPPALLAAAADQLMRRLISLPAAVWPKGRAA